MHRIIFLLSFPILLGCTLGNRGEGTATVNDGVTNNGFTIAAVDGNPPTRWRHPIHTVIPVVVVEPGIHTFTVADDQDVIGVPPFTAETAAGKHYRTEMQDGTPYLLEEVPEDNPFGTKEDRNAPPPQPTERP